MKDASSLGLPIKPRSQQCTPLTTTCQVHFMALVHVRVLEKLDVIAPLAIRASCSMLELSLVSRLFIEPEKRRLSIGEANTLRSHNPTRAGWEVF